MAPEVSPLTTAARAAADLLRAQTLQFMTLGQMLPILDAVPTVLLVLNRHRQIIYANRALATMLGDGEVEPQGLRPGEVLGCAHASSQCGGCGTTPMCAVCGAAQAIANSERGTASTEECRIVRDDGAALDIRISTTPIELQGEPYIIAALSDISHEKRRHALERIFFHDLLNTAGGISGCAQLLAMAQPHEVQSMSQTILRLAHTLADEIRAQRELLAAESGELRVHLERLSSEAILRSVVDAYRFHGAAAKREIRIDAQASDVTFTSDRALVGRVLGNMVKNALEASPEGGTVTIGCVVDAESVEFSVHNVGLMPQDVQYQVFQRSFSTKSPDRGLGTYSIRLLSERYLKGRVWFTSSQKEGTTFRVRLPLAPPGH